MNQDYFKDGHNYRFEPYCVNLENFEKVNKFNKSQIINFKKLKILKLLNFK